MISVRRRHATRPRAARWSVCVGLQSASAQRRRRSWRLDGLARSVWAGRQSGSGACRSGPCAQVDACGRDGVARADSDTEPSEIRVGDGALRWTHARLVGMAAGTETCAGIGATGSRDATGDEATGRGVDSDQKLT